jgi:hypothetical protein
LLLLYPHLTGFPEPPPADCSSPLFFTLAIYSDI